MSIKSPLEQFEIYSLFPIVLNQIGLNFSFTTSTLFMLIAVISCVIILLNSVLNATIIPTRWQGLVEQIYEFVFEIVYNTIGEKGIKYFPLVFSVFVFVLSCNLLGMIPYSFTVTSHLTVTLSLGLSLFIGITIIGFIEHGLHYFSLLVPKGIAKPLIPVLVVLELISYLIRPFSLSIRLFANMMAGHTLLKIVAGFSWSLFGLGGIFYALGVVPLIALFLFIGLELAVACIQAYVFSVLICSFLSDALNLH